MVNNSIICPSCQKAELKELIPGIKQCPVCKKIFKGLTSKKEEKIDDEDILIKDGQYFMDNTSLNPKWEIAEKGITVFREKNKFWIAVLLCHNPDFVNTKYIRISWWKKAINSHAGMFRIESLDELDNVIIALKKIDELFDENFEAKGKISFDIFYERKSSNLQNSFDENKRLCINCGRKMKLSKNKHYYVCENCGDVIIIEDGKPIFNIPDNSLPLSFSNNFPINYYFPYYGITVHRSMAVWKAIVIIYKNDNPNNKWLRFYWWTRDLQSYMSSQYSFGSNQSLKWEAKKGVSSPNIYDKSIIKKMILALEKIKNVWEQSKINNNVKNNKKDQKSHDEEEDFIAQVKRAYKEKKKAQRKLKRIKKSSLKKRRSLK